MQANSEVQVELVVAIKVLEALRSMLYHVAAVECVEAQRPGVAALLVRCAIASHEVHHCQSCS